MNAPGTKEGGTWQKGACPCGLEDAKRYPLAHDRTLVPTSANCPIHNPFHPDYEGQRPE